MPAYNRHGSCCCSGPGASNCTTYSVRVRDTLGNPLPGIAVTMSRAAGTPTAPLPAPSYAPVSGVTDSNGLFTMTVPTTAPTYYATQATAKIPRGGPAVANAQMSRDGDACTFGFVLCTRARVFDTGLAGAGLAGPGWGVNCVVPNTIPAYWDVAGGQTTMYLYQMAPVTSAGTTGSPTQYGAASGGLAGEMPGAVGCKSGYWGGCVPAAIVACETTRSDAIQMTSQDQHLFNPRGACNNTPSDVILKQMCVTISGDNLPIPAGSYTLDWVATSWDGRGGDYTTGMLSGGTPTMRFLGGSGTSEVRATVSPSSTGDLVIGVAALNTSTGVQLTRSGTSDTWGGITFQAGYSGASGQFAIREGSCDSPPADADDAGPTALSFDPDDPPPAAPPSLAPPRPTPDLSPARAILACPHKSAPGCSCNAYATCGLGKGTAGQVLYADCLACQSPPGVVVIG